MKSLKLILITILLTGLNVLAQNVNDKVKVESNGTWYDATILKVNSQDGTYFIAYDGWSESWNEWITTDRMKYDKPVKAPLTKFSVGDRVEVEYGMIPEPATIIEVGENKYHIKFDKSVYGDKWVTEREIKKL